MKQTDKIFVGLKHKELVVHKKRLYAAANSFEKAFNGSFKEGQEDEMYLSDNHPGAFAFLIE